MCVCVAVPSVRSLTCILCISSCNNSCYISHGNNTEIGNNNTDIGVHAYTEWVCNNLEAMYMCVSGMHSRRLKLTHSIIGNVMSRGRLACSNSVLVVHLRCAYLPVALTVATEP